MSTDQEKSITKDAPWHEGSLAKGVECYVDDESEEMALDYRCTATIIEYRADEEFLFLASDLVGWKFAVPVDEDLRVVKQASK